MHPRPSDGPVSVRRIVSDDGVALHCETRGAGPPLLLLHGGVSSAAAVAELAHSLAEDFLVITYDRRGLARSPAPLDSPWVDMHRQAQDAATILQAHTSQPANIVGSSFGALLALHLVLARPDMVATVVAHEPPLPAVVRDPELEDAMQRIARTAQRDIHRALGELAALADDTDQEQRPDEERADRAGETAGPGEYGGDDGDGDHGADETVDAMRWFFRHDLHAVLTSRISGEQLNAMPTRGRIVPAVGRESAGRWENRCAQELAARIRTPVLELPGGHDGFSTHPQAVVEHLHRRLTA